MKLPAQLKSTDFHGLAEFLGTRSRRKLGNNTYALRLEHEDAPASIGIELHDTVVVELFDNGTYALNSGGWRTVTTKDRINTFLPYPFVLIQKDRRWFLWQVYHATNGEGRYWVKWAEFEYGYRLCDSKSESAVPV